MVPPPNVCSKSMRTRDCLEGDAVKFPLVPDFYFESIHAIDLARLRARGVRLLLADLDNTLVPYGVHTPTQPVRAWKQALEDQGIQLFLLSNSRKPGRAQSFAQRLGIPYQGHSGKPRRAGYLRAMERMGRRPEETVMVGDQIFTDTLGANNAGVVPLLVEPIRLAGNPGRYLRYAAETPFRLLGKRRPFL